MKTKCLRLILTAQCIVILTALFGITATAQQDFLFLPKQQDLCNIDAKFTVLQALPTRTISQGNKANVDLFHTQTFRALKKCAYQVMKQFSPTSTFGFRGESFEEREAAGSGSLPDQGAPGGGDQAQELAKKLSNPVASLISFPMQSNFDFKMGTGSGWRYTLNVQPVVPFKLTDNWNLISRTILPVIHQGNVTGPGMSQSGLGDILQSFFFSPSKREPFVWSVGPVVLIPTATDDALGSKKLGLGPTALVLKQTNGWTFGVLANHVWSVAGKSSRSEINSTFLQPFLSYNTRDAWTYSINTETSYDWVSNSWSVPIHLSISKLVRFGKQPVSFGGGLRCWATSPVGGPHGCGLRIVVTALFPK
jgi:hypothetical protein